MDGYMRLVTTSGTIESSGEYIVIRPEGDRDPIYLGEQLTVALAQCASLLDFIQRDHKGLTLEQLQFAPNSIQEGYEQSIFTIQARPRLGDYLLGYASHPNKARWGKANRIRVDAKFLDSLMRIVLWKVSYGAISDSLSFGWLLRGRYEDGHIFMMTDQSLLISDNPANNPLHAFSRDMASLWVSAFDRATDFIKEGVGSFVYGRNVGEGQKADFEVVGEDEVEIEFWERRVPMRFTGRMMNRASGLMDFMWRPVSEMMEDYVEIRGANDEDWEDDD